MHFVIHYGPAADFEDEALALARRLFAYFDEAIDSLALIPVGEAEFDLFLDGCLIHSYRRSGRPPRLSDLLQAWRAPQVGSSRPAPCGPSL